MKPIRPLASRLSRRDILWAGSSGLAGRAALLGWLRLAIQQGWGPANRTCKATPGPAAAVSPGSLRQSAPSHEPECAAREWRMRPTLRVPLYLQGHRRLPPIPAFV